MTVCLLESRTEDFPALLLDALRLQQADPLRLNRSREGGPPMQSFPPLDERSARAITILLYEEPLATVTQMKKR